ncbi:MAG: DNA replication/repair protein RecF [Ferrimicrobium sp.]
MRLVEVSFSGFRNLHSDTLYFEDGASTAIVGLNGHGKTNLLEAIGLALSNRSFRTSDRTTMVTHGQPVARVSALVHTDAGRRVESSVVIVRDGQDRVELNGVVSRSMRQVVDLPVVAFQPTDLEIIRGAPAGRRVFLDSLASYLVPTYADLLRKGDRILRQRQTLLHQLYLSTNAELSQTLDIFDTRLALVASEIVAIRESVVDSIRPEAQRIYYSVSQRSESLTLRYRCSWNGDLYDELKTRKDDDIRRGTTSVGYHRDDLVIELDSRSIREVGSQGQIRSTILALRFASAIVINQDRDEAPIVLLDDIFSELDPERIRILSSELPPFQVFSTGTVPILGWCADQTVEMVLGKVTRFGT